MTRKLAFKVLGEVLSALFYIAAALGIAYLCMLGYQFMYSVFSNPVYNSSAQTLHTVTVREDERPLEVMRQLEDKGVIQDYKVAYVRLYLSGYQGHLQPGSYYVTAAMPLDEILGVLAADAQTDEQTDDGGS